MTEVTTGRLSAGPTADELDARLSEGAMSLARGGGEASPLRSRHVLLAASATLMVLGLAAIVLAWIGIARSTMVEEQLAYLVSGGLLGLALSTIGALTFFSHWMTELIRSNHEQTAILRELRDDAIARRQEREEVSNGRPRGTGPRRPVRRASSGS